MITSMDNLVCEHGSLRRKCELCERDERIAELERERDEARKALRGFLEKGTSLALSHPHLAAYVAFPDEVWIAARAAAKEKP